VFHVAGDGDYGGLGDLMCLAADGELDYCPEVVNVFRVAADKAQQFREGMGVGFIEGHYLGDAMITDR
jgi:hypothetical protein